jgi:hypothetical protein
VIRNVQRPMRRLLTARLCRGHAGYPARRGTVPARHRARRAALMVPRAGVREETGSNTACIDRGSASAGRMRHQQHQEPTMKFAAACATAIAAVVLAAAPAAAQQQPRPEGEPRPAGAESRASLDDIIQRSGIIEALEALAAAAAPELERTAEQLGEAVAGLATRLAEDRELRLSAARAARGMVDVAEIVVVEHSATLLDALREAAARIEAVTRERAKPDSELKRDGDARP